MKKTKLICAFAALAFAAACVFALATPAALAAEDVPEWRVNPAVCCPDCVTAVLDELVAAGTLTADQKAAIIGAAQKACPGREHGGGPLQALITDGTITQAQAKTILRAIMTAMKDNRGRFDPSAVLSGLVSAGSITEAQKTAIKAALEQGRSGPEFRGSQDGTFGLRRTLDELVAAGTITPEQETAILTALKDRKPCR